MFHHHSLFESDRLRVKVKTVAIWKAVLPETVNRRSLNLTTAYQQQIQCIKFFEHDSYGNSTDINTKKDI